MIEARYVALKVGYEFAVINLAEHTYMIDKIKYYGAYVKVEGAYYPVYSGKTYDDSRQVDKLLDTKYFWIYSLNKHLVDDELSNLLSSKINLEVN
ncbi:TPA: hypothetical protein ACGWER_002022 [Streptococcus agalactiae]|nr:hypothetical protein [Streptococcus agalactiae]HEO2267346.1 hypothetical protein [Streptococcus agalactiae]